MRRLLTNVFVGVFMLPIICNAQKYRDSHVFEEVLDYAIQQTDFDKLLVNGPSYENKYFRAIGHPFFLENEYVNGEVVYAGLRFSEKPIKFSSFEQQLVMKIETESFSRELVLPMEHVTEFKINDYHFRKYDLFGTGPAYYQVVTEKERITCLYLWTKSREISDHLEGYLSYKFGKDKAKKYLLMDGVVESFKNNRSYVKLFPEYAQPAISGYLKERKMKLQKMSDKSMKELVQFCDDTLETVNR